MACPIPCSSVSSPLEVFAVLWPSGVREIGYDNERGKGDHRHFQGTETAYAFTSVERLIADFWSDVERVRGDQ